MIELVAALLFISLLIFIAYPFFRPPETSAAVIKHQSRLEELLNEKEEAYLSLKDIEQDFRMGKLSKHDYEISRQESEKNAIEVLKKIEAEQAAGDRSPRKSARKG